MILATRLGRMTFWLVVLVGASTRVASTTRAADTTSTLIGSGDWTDNSVWNTPLFPNNGNGGLTYDAIVNSGAVNIPALTDIVIKALSHNGGSIGGEGSLQLNAPSTWTAGTLAGPTTGMGQLTLSGTGAVTASGPANKFFGGSVTNAGTLLWQEGVISPNTPGGTFTNTGLVDLQGDGSSFSNVTGWPGTVVNAAGGTLRRSVGTGTASISLPIDNQGTIDVDSGTLRFAAGGSSSGVFDVAAGAYLDLSGGFTLNNGASSTGAGVVRFTSGTLAVNGTATMNNFEFSGGIVSGGVNLSGNGNWTGGTFDGVTLGAGATTTASGPANKFFNGAVTNAGTLLWQEGVISPNTPGGTFTNTGLVDLQGDGSSFSNITGWPGTVVNAAGGTLRRSVGTGTASVSLPVTNQGTIEVRSGTLDLTGGLTNIDVPTVTLAGGAYRAIDVGTGATLRVQAPGIATLATGTTLELSGAGAAILFDATAPATSLANNAGTLQIHNGHHFNMTSALNNTGAVALGGAGLLGGTLTSAGNIVNSASGTISGHGVIDNTILNSGTVRASGGTLAVVGGAIDGQSGTVQVDAGATLNLSGASSASDGDFLIHNGSGLNLGGNNFLVAVDYQNAGFGVGNAFNPRANVTGTGAINASPGVTQTISGQVTGGGTATATMNFGNVHVGSSTTRNYQINNVGTGGPSLRGAIQTTASGASITDGRLSGGGVTASNFGPIGAGANSGNRAVTFSPTTAGSLVNQHVRILNNFDNVAEQMIQFTGGAYRYAAPVHTPEPINLGNRHVGDAAPSQVMSVQNNVPADGFSESLNATIGSPTGGITTNGGSFASLNPGATNNTSLAVGYSTATAGNKAGTATLTLTSNGSGSSGLGLTPLTARTVNVTGSVYRLASAGAHTPEPVNFGIIHVGDAATRAVSIANTAINDGFSERLNGSIGSATGAALTNAGTFSGLAPGSTNNSSLLVGVDTATAGTKSGTATVSLTSTGVGTSGLANSPLASQTVNVMAQVNNYAAPFFSQVSGAVSFQQIDDTHYLVDLGKTDKGQAPLAAQLRLTNSAIGPADQLAGTWNLAGASDFGLTGFSPFTSLGAGSMLSGLGIELPTSAVGNFSGQLVLNPRSQNTSGFDGALANITISIVGLIELGGDFNLDGSVDSADFTVWRDGLGTTYTQGDYDKWRVNFGMTSGSTSSALPALTSVPEPHSLVIMFLFGVGALLTDRRTT